MSLKLMWSIKTNNLYNSPSQWSHAASYSARWHEEVFGYSLDRASWRNRAVGSTGQSQLDQSADGHGHWQGVQDTR